MTIDQVLEELKANGSEQIKKVLVKHGAREPFFGVKVEYLKKLQKKIKKDHDLALRLYATGNTDAMYFAAMICDPLKMSEVELQDWVENAYWYYLSEHAVPSVTADNPVGLEIALRWIKSEKENIASAGWATLSTIITKRPDVSIDKKIIESLLSSIPAKIHSSQNRVRHCMNNFIIASGGYITELYELSRKVAVKVGKVKVDMGGTACKVPDAITYIEKVRARAKK